MTEHSSTGNPATSVSDALVGELVNLSAYLSTWLARSRLLSNADMHRIAFESAERVRCILASRRDVDSVLLDELSTDARSSIRLRVACNANCSPETLMRLSMDADSLVKAAAADRLRFRWSAKSDRC